MAEIRQFKVKKMLIFSTRLFCSVMPITSAHVLSHFVTFVVKLLCNFSPSRSISLEQWRSAIGCFYPIVGCELNVNARMCKHDVTRFISYVPVWLFHLVSGSFTEALQMPFIAKVCILVKQYLM